MTLMVAVLIGRTADSLASIPERLAQPAVERPYPLPEIEVATQEPLERLDADWLEHRIRPGESFYQIMRAMGFDPGTVQSVMESGQQTRPLLELRPGQVLRASAPDGVLQALDLEIDSLNKLEIRRDDGGYFAQLHTRPTQTTQNQAAGVIDSSLYLSAQQAGLS
ncbi:MAG TPA: hypothetical protein DIT63_10040, partial [Gammaproteobacteria bacterium]|nr:hypothetical protein [Gammaproteobacteria bacterium]